MTPFEGIYEVIAVISTIITFLAFMGFIFDVPKDSGKMLGGVYILSVLICQAKLLLVIYG